MRRLSLIFGLAAVALSSSLIAGIANTKHNLSTSGTGTIKATDGEGEICIFCHTPHNANPVSPLWNRTSPGGPYTPYTSTTLIGTPGQPTGSSVLCLSCHDGTVALGDILSRADITLTDTFMPAGATLLTTDLSDDHPVSFAFTSTLASTRGELIDPSTLTAEVKLDGNGEMQCTSCHNPHTDAVPKFLVKSNTASALCKTCHSKNYWADTSHSTEAATWNGTGTNPWPHTTETTVANNGCENCHRPHTAGNGERILNYAVEETNCLVCHNGNINNPTAIQNIETEFSKASVHPIALTTGTHDANETNVPGTARHVECFDCHNPHGAQSNASNQLGPLNGARGVDINNADIQPVSFPYQVCMRCHGDSTDKPLPLTNRALDGERDPTNVRLEFNPTESKSYHPVAAAIGGGGLGYGGLTRVPSLLTGSVTLTLESTGTGFVEHGSTISCLDCHNNDQNPNAGGTGPSGPHGSANSPILERNFITLDNTTENATTYAMCYKCHNRTAILNNDATTNYDSFRRHDFHATGGINSAVQPKPGRGLTGASCNICHDPHGSRRFERNINFDTSIVTPNGIGELYFARSADGSQAQCNLSCHGQDHNPCGYLDRTGAMCGCGHQGGGGGNNAACGTVLPAPTFP